MTRSTVTRAALALAGAGALAASGGALAHADEAPADSGTAAGTTGEAAAEQDAGSGVPNYVLQGVPALPLPDALLTPVDLAAPVYGLLGGLS